MYFPGELAALVAAIIFSATATFFTLSGRRFGPSMVMRGSLPMGLAVIFVLQWLRLGQPFPTDIEPVRWLWLGASGILGFWLGALAVVNGFVRIGPRLTLLITTTAPVLGAVVAWVFLDERLGLESIIGIVLTIGGIMWVVSERGQQLGKQVIPPADYRAGVLFALAGASAQGFSFVFSKQGVQGDFNPLTGIFMRLLVATVGIWLFTIVRRQVKQTLVRFRSEPVAVRQLVIGAVSGPALGAFLVLVALQRAPVGVASTLAKLTPIFLIPISYIVFRERITHRAVIGTVIAFTGVAVLFL